MIIMIIRRNRVAAGIFDVNFCSLCYYISLIQVHIVS
jgi:hypothetical protein